MDKAFKKFLRSFGDKLDFKSATRETWYVYERFFNGLSRLVKENLRSVDSPRDVLNHYLDLEFCLSWAESFDHDEIAPMFFERVKELGADPTGLPYVFFESEHAAKIYETDIERARAIARSTYEKALRLRTDENKQIVADIISRSFIILEDNGDDEDDDNTEKILAFAKKCLRDNVYSLLRIMRGCAARLFFVGGQDRSIEISREALTLCIENFGEDSEETLDAKEILLSYLYHDRDADEILRLATDVKRFIYRRGSPTDHDWAELHSVACQVNLIEVRKPEYRMIQDFCRKNFHGECMSDSLLPKNLCRKYLNRSWRNPKDHVKYLRRRIKKLSYRNPYRIDLMKDLARVFAELGMTGELARLNKKIAKLTAKYEAGIFS